jgi:hypothetical protein
MGENNELDRLLAECDEICAEVDGSDREVFARLKTRDGRPIVMGGTYYGAGDNKAWRVVGYGRAHVFCDGMPEQGKRLKPEWLMAKPDSWERVQRDACEDAATYCDAHPWMAPVASGSYCVPTVAEMAVRTDLVARCKALAGVR